MRRLQGPVRALALLLAATIAAAGCTKVGTEPGGAGGGNAWTHHGVLRMANLSEPDNLNPIVGNQQIDSDLSMFWGGYFFEWNDRNEYVPDLATEVPTSANGGISKDGRTIVYHLRHGVLWHDGKPFSADDVIFTYHAIMSKANNVPSTVGYDLIDRIDKIDPYTIRVHLKSVWAPFIATFFNQSGTPYPVLPEHVLGKLPNINRADFNSQPIGTGPFVVQHWQRGSKIVFDANPHYWRGAPKLKRIEYTPIPSENTIVTGLQAHDIDFEYNGASANYEVLKSIEGTRVVLTPFTQFSQIILNCSSPMLDDVRVRRALWYGLDTNDLIAKVTHGVQIRGYTDQPEFLWAYDPDVTHYDYDPAKAKALLDQAGWKPGPDGIRAKNGHRLALIEANVQGSATGTAVSVLAQKYWHDIGVDLSIKNYVSSLFFATYGAGGIVQGGKFDVAFLGWINGTDPDDSTLFMADQIPPRGQNAYRFKSAELDAAEKVALSHYDRPTRKKAYATVQRILADQVPVIIAWYVRRIAVMNSDFKGYKPAHAVTTFWNSYEWEI